MPPLCACVCAAVIDMRLWIGLDSLALPTKVTASLTNATCAEAKMPVASCQLPVAVAVPLASYELVAGNATGLTNLVNASCG